MTPIRCGAWANIPPKVNRKTPICFSKYLYRARNLVERFFNKIKHFRRIATRYDKLAENFLAALKLAAVRIWLSNNESTSWSIPGSRTSRGEFDVANEDEFTVLVVHDIQAAQSVTVGVEGEHSIHAPQSAGRK